jgi:general secretion pathway protein G
MVVVLLIIGMLVAGVAVNVLGQSDKAKIEITKRNLVMVRGAVETYLATQSALPTTLRTLVDSGSLADNSFQDEWRRDFQFGPQPNNPKRPFVLWSMGADGQPGTEDDIDAWEISRANSGSGQPNTPR